jgi:hypothetical protein
MRALYLFNHSDKDIGWGGGEHGGWINFTAPSRVKEDVAATGILNVVLQECLGALYIWIRASTWGTINLDESISKILVSGCLYKI